MTQKLSVYDSDCRHKAKGGNADIQQRAIIIQEFFTLPK